jgi:hypothetical protein
MLSISERCSGLLLAEQAAVPADIRAALKRVDPELALDQQVDQTHRCWLWRVFRRDGDRPAVWLFDWRENMDDPRSRPRPLSHAIVSEAAERRLSSRRPHVDPLAANDRMLERQTAEDEELHHEIAREVAGRRGRVSPPKPSVGLRMARDKMRARGLKA